MKITTDLRIGIIGGAGKTGSQFAQLFEKQGFTVDVTGAETQDRNAALLRDCAIVIFSVPLARSVDIMEAHMPSAVREDQLLLDLSSLKTKQTEALLRGAGEVIGMHPLFGPWTDPVGETIILCPERAAKDTLESLTFVLHAMGLRTKHMSAAEHDRLMALLQVLPHVKNFLVADVLKRTGADLSEVLATCTPPYELELNVVGRFLDDSPELYGPIILENPGTLDVLEAFHEALGACIAMARSKDLDRFSQHYGELQAFFGPHAKQGRESTEACIRLLSSLHS